jgi:hypothetical protein
VWNQAGVETTFSTAVTIDPAGASADILADFSTNGSGSSGATLADTSGGSAGSLLLSDVPTQSIGIPLTGSE